MVLKACVAGGAIAAALFAAPAAQAASIVVEANGASFDDLNGGELGVGVNITQGAFRLTPMVGAFIFEGNDDRYRKEQVGASHTGVCRDLSNGQFADKEKCFATDAKAYGKLEAAYRFGRLELGAGVRISDEATPYGLVAATITDHVAVKGFGGLDYYGLGVAVSF